MPKTDRAMDDLIAEATIRAASHRPDYERGCCSCGFCVWSVEHVLHLAISEAWPHVIYRLAALTGGSGGGLDDPTV